MEDNGYDSFDEIDEQASEQNHLFHIGKPIWEKIAEIQQEGDRHLLEAYLANLGPDEQRAVDYMNERNDRVVDQIKALLQSRKSGAISAFLDQALPVDRKVLRDQFKKLERRLESLAQNRLDTATSPLAAHGPTAPDDPTIDALADSWLSRQSRMANSSRGEYERVVRFFVAAVTELNRGRPPRASNLTPDLIRRYKDALEKYRRAPARTARRSPSLKRCQANARARPRSMGR